ncbi:EAL domain-containing protein [Pseudomonas sp. SL4(2022)]|uniref:EAL domain-containing protein n=1 Tax=Pseudomonas sp. SL4(2022) TaxID=2994661 RepID=UPI0022719045|nr:EAL domain-containing protein [Pseudomonas sp. SL4(2022)]WAC46455.1 EAL domain-containing protein [Pseudomonas sp. SL4(2022)]
MNPTTQTKQHFDRLQSNNLKRIKAHLSENYSTLFSSPAKGAITTLCVALSLGAAVLAADTLSQQYLVRKLTPVIEQNGKNFLAIKMQTATTLNALNELPRDVQACSEAINVQLTERTKTQRYIYASAIKLDNGKVCTSYGQTLQAEQLPNDQQANHYRSNSGVDYWFNANRQVNSDKGEIIIGQHHAYVWLNKGIINESLTAAAGVELDLLDERTLQPVFSSDNTPWPAPERRLEWNKLTFGKSHVYLATPTQANGLLAVASTPVSQYLQALLTFSAVFLVLAWALLKTTLKLHAKYFSLPAKLRHAINTDKLEIRYQPIVDMNTKQWVGAEALLRCTLNGQNIGPNVLIPMAQRAGLMRQLTRRVCTRVAEDHTSLMWACKDFYISINLSAEDVLDESFPEFTKSLFAHYQVPSSRIVFEITEESLNDKAKAIVQLNKLREQGHKIAIDDFGTGYSSMSHLDTLPADILKIDRSFITPDKLKYHNGIWWHIISMARVQGLTVIAEGIETDDQADILSYAGVNIAQGWLYSKDLSASNLARHFFMIQYPGLA